MNKFGIALVGKRGVYRKESFFKPNAQRQSRTFIFEGGPGCNPKPPLKDDGQPTSVGLLFGNRTISGRWESDGQRDTVDIDAFECVIDHNGEDILPKDAQPAPVEVETVAAPAETETAKPAAAVAEPKPARVPKAETTAPKPQQKADGKWDPERAVELFKGGMKIADIAVEMGYVRGQGQNRVRGVLKAAGVYDK